MKKGIISFLSVFMSKDVIASSVTGNYTLKLQNPYFIAAFLIFFFYAILYFILRYKKDKYVKKTIEEHLKKIDEKFRL